MKKIVAGLVVVLGFCACAHRTSGTLDVNKALDYCAEQTQRSLVELKGDSGIDYTMMPRNVMADELIGTVGKQRRKNGVPVSGRECCGMIMSIHKTSIYWKKPKSLRHP